MMLKIVFNKFRNNYEFKYWWDHLLPLALSKCLPSALTLGAVCDPFWPGYKPKCLLAYLSLVPLIKRTFYPFGAIWANWSQVKHSPFAFWILSLAWVVNLRAQTLSPSGTFRSLVSLVTDPTMAKILELNLVFPYGTARLSCVKCFEILEIEIGYLFNLDWFSLLWTVVLNLDSVLLAKNA